MSEEICPLCWVTLQSRTLLKCHLKETHTQEGSQKYHCHLCTVSFTEKRYLRAHIKRHFDTSAKTKNAKKPIADSIVPKPDDPEWFRYFYRKITNFTEAEFEPRTKTDKNLPPQINSKLWWESESNNFPPQIFQITPPPVLTCVEFECQKCGKHIYHQSKAHLHYLRCYQISTLACEVCKRIHPDNESLKRHKFKKHNIVTFDCSICKAELNNLEELFNHLKIHDFDLELLCKVCGKIFKNRKAIRRHAKVHDKSKAAVFECSVCLKKFTTRDSCVKHHKTHAKKCQKSKLKKKP